MIRCPACSAENKPSTRFCHACGATLTAPAAAPESADDDRTVLIAQSKRTPGTIEQAMRLTPEGRKPGERPPPTPPDNDMTVILPKKSGSPPPKYEPAPPTVIGPLSEPAPRGKSSKRGADREKPELATAAKPRTPFAVVLALLLIAGGSAGYLGWLILKKGSVPAEKVAVAPRAAPPSAPPSVKAPAPPEPVPPAAVVTPPAAVVTPPAAVVAPPAAVVAPPAAVVAPPAAAVAPPAAVVTQPAAKAPPAPAAPPAGAAIVRPLQVAPPAPPKPVAKVDGKPVSSARAESSKTDTGKVAKSDRKEQTRPEAAKKKAAAATPSATGAPRAAEPPRLPAPAPVEADRQEASPLALLRDDLRACDAQSVFTRESCKSQARQRRCAGLWDRVAECPYKKELY